MQSSLDQLETFDADGSVRMVVEATAGTRSKLKYEPALQAFALHHVLPPGLSFPLDFGFMPGTMGEDGDPLDALVFTDEPLPCGIVVAFRLLGVLEATQAGSGAPPTRNDRFIGVARSSHAHAGWRELADVPQALLAPVGDFFVNYNASRGVDFKVHARHGRAQALALLSQGQERFRRR